MFEKIKRRALRKHIERNLGKRDRSEVNAPMKTLGFVVDERLLQDFEKLYDLAGYFHIHPNDISVFSFLEVKKKQPSLRQNQVNNKHFTWKGDLHNQNAEEFLNRSFDVLVGFYAEENVYMDLLVSESEAKFKVGFSGADDRLFDLVLGMSPNDFNEFKKELKKYLEVLGKIEAETSVTT